MPNSIGVWIVYAGMGFVLGIAYRVSKQSIIMAHNTSIVLRFRTLSLFAIFSCHIINKKLGRFLVSSYSLALAMVVSILLKPH